MSATVAEQQRVWDAFASKHADAVAKSDAAAASTQALLEAHRAEEARLQAAVATLQEQVSALHTVRRAPWAAASASVERRCRRVLCIDAAPSLSWPSESAGSRLRGRARHVQEHGEQMREVVAERDAAVAKATAAESHAAALVARHLLDVDGVRRSCERCVGGLQVWQEGRNTGEQAAARHGADARLVRGERGANVAVDDVQLAPCASSLCRTSQVWQPVHVGNWPGSWIRSGAAHGQ